MPEQNFKNHSRYVPGFHFLTSFLIIALFIGSLINLFTSAKDNLYSASLICLAAVILGFFFAYMRTFPLKAQDRVIRAEENFRHYVLAGKPLDTRLTMRQVIALRFAGDDEFVDLAKRAAVEGLSTKEIKAAIQSWRADNHRM